METIDALVLDNIYQLLPTINSKYNCLLLSGYLLEVGLPIFNYNLRQLLVDPLDQVVSKLVSSEDIGGLGYLHNHGGLNNNSALIESIRQSKPSVVNYLLTHSTPNYDQALHQALLTPDSTEKLQIRDSIITYFQLWLNIKWAMNYQSAYSMERGIQ